MATAEQSEGEFQKLDVGALERTRVAYERTMLAWIRTAASLITFGFTIYKFFQLQSDRQAREIHRIGSREFALLLVGTGLASLLLATLDFRRNLRALLGHRHQHRRSLAVIVAGLISVAGIFALVVMLARA